MRSHVSLTCLGVFVLTLLKLDGASETPSLLEIGNRKQLFIDDYMIQSLSDARQVLNPATKSAKNPVVRPDRPWEGRLSPISKVLYDEEEGLFKMWYSTTDEYKAQRGGGELTDYRWTDKGAAREKVEAAYRYIGDPGQYTYRLCYATSRDGIHWEKPGLGKVEFNGSRSNNILPEDSRAPTFFDTNEKDPARRYKAIRQTRSSDPQACNSTSTPPATASSGRPTRTIR